ncbi:MAG: hypothetical protein M3Q45_02550 [Chloroflexota bacterium]|nr:hypothetical protein [Chloroflexota bacterium]
MGQNLPGFSQDKRSDNDNRKPRVSEPQASMEPVQPKKLSWGEQWNATPITKTVAFWSSLAAIALVLLLGFNWGGWVTGGTAQTRATALAKEAVITRLAPICVAQFQQDPAKAEKLIAFKALSSYERSKYGEEQGWATMPGEAAPDRTVAAACANLLMQIN